MQDEGFYISWSITYRIRNTPSYVDTLRPFCMSKCIGVERIVKEGCLQKLRASSLDGFFFFKFEEMSKDFLDAVACRSKTAFSSLLESKTNFSLLFQEGS